MRLDEHVRTNNNIETTKSKYGVCISMTTQWILASKRHDGVTRTWQIGSGGAFRIRQAAGMIGQQRGDDNIIRNAGLFVQSERDDPTLIGIATQGYHILSIWNAAGNSGHSMGSWAQGAIYQFFDPNFGLFHADNSISLIGDVLQHCRTVYPGLNAEHILRKIA
jgi:hypothetical protein